MTKFKLGEMVWIKSYKKEGRIMSVLGVDPEENTRRIQYYDVEVDDRGRTFYPTVAEYDMEVLDVS